MTEFKRCKGSGELQMLAWFPDSKPSPELDGKPYPGAVVCMSCSFGVMIVRGSDRAATSVSGFEGRAGKVRVHYVTKHRDLMSYRKSGK